MEKRKLMKHCNFTVLILLITLIPLNSYPMDLPELIGLAKEHPEILAIKEKIEQAKAKTKRVQALPDPEISLGYSKKEDMSNKSIMLQQEFPYPGKLSLMGEVESQAVKMLEQELSVTILKKIAETKKDYYELFLTNKEIGITNRTKKYLKLIEEIANTMYSTGMISQTDVLRIQTEISMQIEKLVMLEAKKETIVYRIMWCCLGLPGDTPKMVITLPDDLTQTELKDYELLQDMAIKTSPMLKMTGYEIEMRRKEVDLAKREFKPDFVSSAE
ncbi:TolC family protein, partial [bacterium]|nr:TolC family protein [bacterium]